MKPTVDAVLEAIGAVSQVPWPSVDDDPVAWLQGLGLAPTSTHPRFPGWGSGVPGWGDAETCWSVVDGSFSGVGWVLWHELSSEEMLPHAEALRAALHEAYGPCDRCCPGETGFRCAWPVNDRTVELLVDTVPTEGRHQVVQVHVLRETTMEECSGVCCMEAEAPPTA